MYCKQARIWGKYRRLIEGKAFSSLKTGFIKKKEEEK
jgi:hypothetical protein